MYYSNCNFEAFARPEKAEGAHRKSVYLIGSGLASLSAAAFLIRDGGIRGEDIRILEPAENTGGGNGAQAGVRGVWEIESHFECLWDLFRSIPSLETRGASVLDEFHRQRNESPHRSPNRTIQTGGEVSDDGGSTHLTGVAAMEALKLFFTPEEMLAELAISDVFFGEFFSSSFWLNRCAAFEPRHSAMELRRQLARLLHSDGSLPDSPALSGYYPEERLILPLARYLESHGVKLYCGATVTDVLVDCAGGRKQAVRLCFRQEGENYGIDLTEHDLVIITNGSAAASAGFGDQHTPAALRNDPGDSWTLWRNLAGRDPAFGRPEVFYGGAEQSVQVSATVTLLDDGIAPYLETVCGRDSHRMVTVRDSGWLMRFVPDRRPGGPVSVWISGACGAPPGNHIRKAMRDCTGAEITREWLFHLGVPEEHIGKLAEHSADCVPCVAPYATACFLPRGPEDRPAVIPAGSVNLAFVGDFAETPRDAAATAEYAVRTAMEAVYTLLGIDRGVPEVCASAYDVRALMDAASHMLDGKKLTDLELPLHAQLAEQYLMKRFSRTVVCRMMRQANLL